MSGTKAVFLQLLLYPLHVVLASLLAILRLFALPLLYLYGLLRAIALTPFYILRKFESILIYLSAGVIVGLVAGVCLFVVFTTLSKICPFNAPVLTTSKSHSPMHPGRTFAEYRKSRKQKRTLPIMSQTRSFDTPISPSENPYRSPSEPLAAQTILEEEDSE